MAPENILGAPALGVRFTALLGEPDAPGWTAVDEFFGQRLPNVLVTAAAYRGARSIDVAATLLFEQYCQRLVGPVLAALHPQPRDSIHGAAKDRNRIPDPQRELVLVLLREGALQQVAFRRTLAAVDGASAAGVMRELVADNLEPLAAAVHRQTRASLRVLRGAMANATTNAFLHLSWARPDRAHHLHDAATLLKQIPDGPELVNIRAVEVEGQRWMYTDRNTCCQAFRTTINQARDQKVCATCPVMPRSQTERMFRQAVTSYSSRHA